MAPYCFKCIFIDNILKLLIFVHSTDGTSFRVAKADCMVRRRVVPGDVVTFTHDFASRRVNHASDVQYAVVLGNNATQTQTITDLSDTARAMQPPAHGSFPQGVPSNPIVYRVRDDLTWQDVINSSTLSVRQFMNGLPHIFPFVVS
jgi:hypothetical protein